jgi:futalosine hydrolase
MILIVAATAFEIQSTIEWLEKQNIDSPIIKILITGIGTPSTMFSTMKSIAKVKPDLIIHAGIAGTFNQTIGIGEVVLVESEQWSDLGIEDNNHFFDLFDMKFSNPDVLPYINGEIKSTIPLLSSLNHCKKVKAVTSNTAHGNRQSIQRIIDKYNPAIESMEGAAIAYICVIEGIPCIQLRSISNIVEPRNRESWNIPLAIEHLNSVLQNAISELCFS